jgi:hypothetical protein
MDSYWLLHVESEISQKLAQKQHYWKIGTIYFWMQVFLRKKPNSVQNKTKHKCFFLLFFHMDHLWNQVIILYEPLLSYWNTVLWNRCCKIYRNVTAPLHWSKVTKKNKTVYLGCGIYLCVWTSVGDPDPYVFGPHGSARDPLVTSTDPAPEAAPDPAPDPSIIKQN